MFEKVITKKAKQNLVLLSQTNFIKNFYLAGGTGLALHLGHRKSLDFDFFTKNSFKPEIIIKKISKMGEFSLTSKDTGTLHGLFNNIRVTFLYYPYPVLFSTKEFVNVKVAGIFDIGCMKLDTISRRGSKKDFIDLYFICQEIKFDKLLDIFVKKYRDIDFNMVHVLKSLCYFKEAEKQPMPEMIDNVSWTRVKKFFKKQSKKQLLKK